jgi:4-amino-4-deoxy-L-arabinose transferase-like glycosyltransferase
MTSGQTERAAVLTLGRFRVVTVAICFLIALRAVVSAILPLTADEAYYWLWSRHLAAGYFDHPPAIAFLVRAGTAIFGVTPFGVRVGSFVLSAMATWFVWRAAATLLGREEDGAVAALYFNLTLMVAVEMLAATPDAPEITFAAALFWALVRLDASGDGRWWLGVGAAGGLALLSKYTAFLLGLGSVVWLVVTPEGRPWLRSPWPYVGGAIALLIFSPNVAWNAKHDWITFAFQFGRVHQGELTLRFLAEFLGAQIGMATPFIFALAAMGLALARRDRRLRLVAALIVPSVAYFSFHALHDRVQANWPSFLFPILSIAACAAARSEAWTGMAAVVSRIAARLAAPVAALMLCLCYIQALGGIIAAGRADPFSRLLGFGMSDVAAAIEKVRIKNGAAGLITTDYASTGWLDFYLPSQTAVLALDDDPRWIMAPAAPAALLARPLLYVTDGRRNRHDLIASQFENVVPAGEIERRRGNVELGRYIIYRVSGARSARNDFAQP